MGAIQGPLFGGIARYSAKTSPNVAATVAVGWGIAAFVFTRISTNRPRRVSKWFRIPMFDVRKQPAWLHLLLPLAIVLSFAGEILDGFIDGDGWQIAWSVEFIISFSLTGVMQFRWVRRIQSDPVIMAYGNASYPTYPPIPPPVADRPPPLPPASDA
jgi:hypothetical protein